MKKYAVAALLLFPVFAMAAPFDIHVSTGNVLVDIGSPPPPARVEFVPVRQEGHVWVPGYWAWNGHRHAWVDGRWVRGREGYAYAPGRWEQRSGRWHFEHEHWETAHHAHERHEIERRMMARERRESMERSERKYHRDHGRRDYDHRRG